MTAHRKAVKNLRDWIKSPIAAAHRTGLQHVKPVRFFSQAPNAGDDSPTADYLGVVYDASKERKYSAELEIEGHVISGGDGSKGETEWQAPDAGDRHADIIPSIPQTYLTIDEVTEAMDKEKVIDVYTVDLVGKISRLSQPKGVGHAPHVGLQC
uniref:Uncharacterized protein n=1 Tax=Phytophthora ramorum TaxID=164328 RepID=H3GMT6_PHYRM